MKLSLSLSGLLLMSTAIAHNGNKSNFTDKGIEKIEYAKEMTKELTDFHTLIDQDLDKSVLVNTAAKLHEKPNDKDLAPIVVIVNRAPKGTAPDAQRAKYYVNGRLEATYSVSTGKIGHESRTGYFRPVYTNHLRFYHEYYSGKYGSRMARAIFYSGGYAIHHTDAVKNLGKRASHGCVRFHIDDIDVINSEAKTLGNENYVTRKWSHGHHASWKKNIHYKGLERSDVNPINRYTGKIDYSKTVKSLDMVILVKDERTSDK
jgi:lipoprotein-anchoring transpeptidase ErfK/SrfK